MKIKREILKKAMLARMDELGMNIATLARQAGLNYDAPRDFLIRDKSGMPAADKLMAMLEVLNLTHIMLGQSAPVRNGLRTMREQRGYSVEELAALLPRTTARAIQKLEAGGPLSHEWKAKLARVLECRIDDLDAPTNATAASGASGLHEPGFSWNSGPDKSGSKRNSHTDQRWTAEYTALLPGVPHEFIGKPCVLQLDSGKQLIRRVQPGSKPGHYLLEGLDSSVKPMKNAFVVASALALVLTQA